MNWDCLQNPSGFQIKDNGLIDMYYDEEEVKTFFFGDSFIYGYRILKKCKDLKKYCINIPDKIFDEGLEASRLVINTNYRGLHFTQMMGYDLFHYARENNLRYVLFCTGHQGLNNRFSKFPGMKLFKNACSYPEGSLDVVVFDTKNPLLIIFYKYFYFFIIGQKILKKYHKKLS